MLKHFVKKDLISAKLCDSRFFGVANKESLLYKTHRKYQAFLTIHQRYDHI